MEFDNSKVRFHRKRGKRILNKIDICKMCQEYDVEHKCEIERDYKLISVLEENKKLKKQVNSLKKELSDTKLKMSYMINHNAIGNRNDMGW